MWVPLQGRHVCTLEGGVGEGVRPCNSKELKGKGRRAKGEGRMAKGGGSVAICGCVWRCVAVCGRMWQCDGL